MKRFFAVAGSVLGLLLLVLAGLFLWASSGRLPEDALAQTTQYAAAPDTTAPDTVTVTTYNIGYLSGMTNNRPVVRSDSFLDANLEQALTLLRTAGPDLVGFQEIDYGAARSGYVHQLDTIGARLGVAAAARAVNWDERYVPFPYGRPAVHFGRVLSGQAVLSRFPVRQHARIVLARPPQWIGRDAFYLDRLAQVALLDLGGRPLAVINVHLEAFHTPTREQQARTVHRLYDRLAAQGLPVLLLGDANSTLPDAAGGAAEDADRTMRILLADTDLRPVAPDTGAQAQPGTYPADAPTRTIDHIFYPPDHFSLVDRQVRCGAPSPPSDHCAVTASLRLTDPAPGTPSIDTVPPLDTLLAE
ncbi:MAG: endonuclease/exonuclease/phosphatase family protein [Salinivenus sp.]